MFLFFYNLSIRLYFFSIHLAALFNEKAGKWVAGRKNWRKRYAQDWQGINPKQQPTVWVHCASLGEFEQGRPVIELLRQTYPDCKILLTFFSPSGYDIRKNYPHADYVCYLPFDSRHNALIFMDIFKPDLSIFVKYEFWIHYLQRLHQHNIPTLLISAIFRQDQLFFKPYGKLFRDLLPTFQQIFVQNENSTRLLQDLPLRNVQQAGDTRVDRVLQITREVPDFPVVQAFVGHKKILVVGSSWPPDEAILLPFVNEQLPHDWKMIIAPHQIDEAHLQSIEDQVNVPIIRYSQANTTNVAQHLVLLIDNIGMLAALYRYGHLAYIGGGFGTGIHNTLEPIAFRLPVIFGPKYRKFAEAVQLTQQGGAFSIENDADFKDIWKQLQDESTYQMAATIAYQYVMDNQGASLQIVKYIQQAQLLPAP